jgi:GNAT superfamily N-acetyltransferase
MRMTFDIITVITDHLDLIAPLFDLYRQFYEQPPDLDGARRFISERLSNKQSVIFLALSEGEGLGFVQLYPTFSSVSMRSVWILNDLYVRQEFRRQHIGEALLQRARQFAVESGAKGLELETAMDNFSAHALYESLDWKRSTGFYRYFLNV